MNTENIDLQQMKKAWLEMGEALGMQPSPTDNPENFNKMKTALDRLRDKYRVFWTASLLLAFGTFMIFSNSQIIESPLNLWLGVAYAVYFLTVFCMDYWLWRGIGTINPLRMSVSEVAYNAMFYRKRHLQFMAVLIPMAVALLGFTGYVFSSEIYFPYGMIVGAVCGLIIGIIQFRKFMAEYRKLSE
ncbi:MAG: hypothetical protein NC453_24925 [Muribaculum sp.]|nr:hypothetical protein [Muribaculum sp.]